MGYFAACLGITSTIIRQLPNLGETCYLGAAALLVVAAGLVDKPCDADDHGQ